MEYLEIVNMLFIMLAGGMVANMKEEGHGFIAMIWLSTALLLMEVPSAFMYLLGYFLQGLYPIYLVEKKSVDS